LLTYGAAYANSMFLCAEMKEIISLISLANNYLSLKEH
jgi:hypothetical protein